MKKSTQKLIITFCLALSLTSILSGCVIAVGGDKEGHRYSTSFEDQEIKNRKNISQLHADMNFERVENLMGIADFNEKYEKNNTKIQVLYYRTHRIKKDGLTTKNECTPLIFKNNRLVSWGETAYQQL